MQATIAGGGVIPHIHKSLISKTNAQGGLIPGGGGGGGKGGKGPRDDE